MSKASWINVNPASGNGNKEVSVSAVPYTGRLARTSVLTFTAPNCDAVERVVNQAGKPESTNFNDSTAAAPKEGKTVTIPGISNSAKLTFTLGSGTLDIELPAQYLANSISTDNGAAILGDPGAAAEYAFSIAIVVPANETINTLSRQVVVSDESGNQSVCTITVAEGDPYLTVQEGDINLDYTGAAKSIAVSSNTTWTIS